MTQFAIVRERTKTRILAGFFMPVLFVVVRLHPVQLGGINGVAIQRVDMLNFSLNKVISIGYE
jgi:hypothetical protein